MATFLACPGAGTRRSAPRSAHARARIRTSAPRSRHHRGERYRRPRPGPCAAEAGAQRARSQPRFAAPSACAVAAATGSFFSQRLGELRWPDIDEFALFDLGDRRGDRPVCTVRHGRFEQRHANTQRSLGLHRRRACIHARLDGLDAAAREIAAPKANCILAHTEYLRRSARWSSHRASVIWRAPDPPRRDYAKPPKLRAPPAARHLP